MVRCSWTSISAKGAKRSEVVSWLTQKMYQEVRPTAILLLCYLINMHNRIIDMCSRVLDTYTKDCFPVMRRLSMADLSGLVTRLEAAVSRLEKCGGSGVPPPPRPPLANGCTNASEGEAGHI